MRLPGAAALVLMSSLALLANAEVRVEHPDGVDLGSYRTFGWRPGTNAARPEVQSLIVQAVERELAARGLTQAAEGPADCYVVTHAVAQSDLQTLGKYTNWDRYDVAVIRTDVVVQTTGTLLVDLIDGKSDRPVWRGMANEVINDPALAKVQKKIDKVTRKMFQEFPAR